MSVKEEPVSEWAVTDESTSDVFRVVSEDDILIEEGPTYRELLEKNHRLLMTLRALQTYNASLENELGRLDGLVFRRDGESRRLWLDTQGGFFSVKCNDPDLQKTTINDARIMVVAEVKRLLSLLENP